MKVGDAEESRGLGGIATGVTHHQLRAWFVSHLCGASHFSKKRLVAPKAPGPEAPGQPGPETRVSPRQNHPEKIYHKSRILIGRKY